MFENAATSSSTGMGDRHVDAGGDIPLSYLRERLAGLPGAGIVADRPVAVSARNTVRMLVAADGRRLYAKIGRGLDREVERMRWLANHAPVPDVVYWDCRDGLDLLVTGAVPGVSLLSERFAHQPDAAVRLLARGLRDFHEIDVTTCPFGDQRPGAVVVHGDACLPNFLSDGVRVTGYVDLAGVGLGDRMSDVAAAVWSIGYNFGEEFYGLFFDVYGMALPSPAEIQRLRRGFSSL